MRARLIQLGGRAAIAAVAQRMARKESGPSKEARVALGARIESPAADALASYVATRRDVTCEFCKSSNAELRRRRQTRAAAAAAGQLRANRHDARRNGARRASVSPFARRRQDEARRTT